MPLDSDGRERPFKGLVQSRKRTTQPQGVVGIDWGNPISQGLLYSINPATCFGVESASDEVVTVAGNIGVSQQGVIRSNPTNLRAFSIAANEIQKSQRVTAWARVRRIGTIANFQGPLNKRFNSGANPFNSWSIDYVPGTGNQNDIRASGATAANAQSFTTAYTHPDTTLWHDVCTVRDATTMYLYVDGVLRQSVACAGVGYTNSGDNRVATNAGAGTAPFDYAQIHIFNRDLSAEEVWLLSVNPWQLFAPIKSNHALSLLPKRQVWTPRQTRMLGTSSGSVATVAIQTSKSQVWTKQPQGETRFSNAALDVGLSAYYDGRTGRMVLPDRQTPSVSGAAFSSGVSQAGPGVALAGTGALSYPWNDAYGTGTDLSVCFTVVRTGSYTQFDRLLEFGGYEGTGGWGVEADAAGTGFSFIPWAAGTPSVDLATLPLLQPVTVVIRRGGSTRADHFANGVRTVDTIASAMVSNTTLTLCIGGQRADPRFNRISNIILLQASIFSGRYIPDQFAQELSAAPYRKLFAPRKSKIWVPV